MPHVHSLLVKVAIEVVTAGTCGFYSHLFLFPKPDRSKHPIVDLRALNASYGQVTVQNEDDAQSSDGTPEKWVGGSG